MVDTSLLDGLKEQFDYLQIYFMRGVTEVRRRQIIEYAKFLVGDTIAIAVNPTLKWANCAKVLRGGKFEEQRGN
jgi:hypothetical protein